MDTTGLEPGDWRVEHDKYIPGGVELAFAGTEKTDTFALTRKNANELAHALDLHTGIFRLRRFAFWVCQGISFLVGMTVALLFYG